MSALDHSAYRAPSAGQLRALALMEVDVYRRRGLPQSRADAAAAGAAAPRVWSEAEFAMPLARARARAAGMADAAAWSAAWLQAGLPLPDLAELRAAPAAKRALWRQMRARR